MKARKLDNLKALCASYQSSGLYTHVYAACGFLDADKNTAEFTLAPENRDVFDLSSLTKALVTAPLVLWRALSQGMDVKAARISQLFGEETVDEVGALGLDLSVAAYLRHETGLPPWRNYYVLCEGHRQSAKQVLARARNLTVGRDIYSDVGFITLGKLLETSSGKSLLSEWRERLQTNGICAENFIGGSAEISKDRMISTGYCPVRGRELIGEVHDENCWALGGYSGHSGLFATGDAVSSYLRALWQSKEGRAVFQANFAMAQSTGESLMGWRKGRDDSSKTFASGRGCGHLGFTGTAFWVDPVTSSYAVVLTNRIISARISPAIKEFRAEAFRILWEQNQKSPQAAQ